MDSAFAASFSATLKRTWQCFPADAINIAHCWVAASLPSPWAGRMQRRGRARASSLCSEVSPPDTPGLSTGRGLAPSSPHDRPLSGTHGLSRPQRESCSLRPSSAGWKSGLLSACHDQISSVSSLNQKGGLSPSEFQNWPIAMATKPFALAWTSLHLIFTTNSWRSFSS